MTGKSLDFSIHFDRAQCRLISRVSKSLDFSIHARASRTRSDWRFVVFFLSRNKQNNECLRTEKMLKCFVVV